MDRADSYVPEGRPFKYCSNCGAKIDKDAEICPKCGVRQVTAKPTGSRYGSDVVPPPTEYDSSGVQKIETASIIGIVAIVMSLISFSTVFSLLGFGAVGAVTGLGVYIVLLMVGAILGIVSIVIYRSSFGELMHVDERSFKTPHGLVKYFYIGLIILVVSLVILFIGIAAAASSLSGISSLLGAIGFLYIIFIILLIIALIMVLIGIIGLIMGLWNAGTRYDNTLLKIGGILYIIPYADLVAPILVFIGAHSVRSGLQSGGVMGSQKNYSPATPNSKQIREDSSTRLANLKNLLDSGQITQEDYEAKKKQILDEF
ncbi:MAG: DUF973 family protein [Thermoplasmatales archaeon]